MRRALETLDLPNTQMLLTRCFGLSLSDQYWVRPEYSGLEWKQINFFEDPFSENVGDVLLGKAADAAGRIRFIGNVEASQVFNGDVDVVVTDGFTGNVLLKGIEGSIKYMTRQLKGIFMKNFKTKMAALAIKDEFKALKASLDPNEVGGTAMLGISKPVIKAHGSSDARAIYNAIRQAISFVDSGIIDDITANISYMRVDKHAAKECD